jgi:hypothetical protein
MSLTIGAPRFELGISWPPARRDNQASLRPVRPESSYAGRSNGKAVAVAQSLEIAAAGAHVAELETARSRSRYGPGAASRL